MTLYLIFCVLVLHWLADFVCQTDYQAKNKSKNSIVLLSHVVEYCSVLFVGSVILFWFKVEPVVVITWVLLNGVLHFTTDYITSRITSYLWAKGDVHNFFVVIGFDQLVHYICLFGTLEYLMNS